MTSNLGLKGFSHCHFFSALLLCDILLSLYCIHMMSTNQDAIGDAFSMIKWAHNPTSNTLKVLHRPIFDRAFVYTGWGLKLTNFLMVSFIGLLSMIGTGVDYFMNNAEYPLPLPFHLFFLQPTDLLSYSLNWTSQIFFITFLGILYWSSSMLGLIMFIYGAQSQNVTIALIEKKKEHEIDYDEWLQLTMDTITENRR